MQLQYQVGGLAVHGMVEPHLVLSVAPFQKEHLRPGNILLPDQHIQVRHLPVVDIRVQFFQPAALYRQNINLHPGKDIYQLVPFLQLNNALGQKLVHLVFPLLPYRVHTVRLQFVQASEYQRLDAVGLGN